MDDLIRHETPPKMIAWKALEEMVIEIKFYGFLVRLGFGYGDPLC